jgi:ABC-type transport system involved in cytochrome bd biosynthesis fused ATPase/permease subunit
LLVISPEFYWGLQFIEQQFVAAAAAAAAAEVVKQMPT